MRGFRRLYRMMAPDKGGAAAGDATQEEPQEENPAANDQQDQQQKDGRAYTQADVDQMIGRAMEKWKRQQEEKVSEAQRLANMTEAERRQEEERQREDTLTKREAEVTRRELRAQAMETLGKKGIPSELAELLDYKDADACQKSIEKVGSVWQKAVQKGVEARVAGKTPRTSGGKKAAPRNLQEAIADYYNK